MNTNDLQRLQFEQTLMLKELKRICEKYDLVYYMAYGSLLGTIRHKGTIPWDYDIDVFMKRNDYLKLVQVIQDELPDYLFLKQVNGSDHNYVGLSRIYQKDTRVYYPNHYEENRVDGIHIDIFVVDYAKEYGKALHKILLALCRFISLAQLDSFERNWLYDHFNDNYAKKVIVYISSFLSFLGTDNLQKFKYKLLATKDIRKNGLTLMDLKYDSIFFMDGFDEIVNMYYEDLVVNVPSHYEQLLKKFYGNYMELPPEDKRFTAGMDKVIIQFNDNK